MTGLRGSSLAADTPEDAAREPILGLAPAVTMASLGVLGFIAAACVCWIAGMGSEPREFGLFIAGTLLLPPVCAALLVTTIRPDGRGPTAGTFEALCCWAAVALLVALASVPLVMFVAGGSRDYWKQFFSADRQALAVSALALAAAVPLAGGRVLRRALSRRAIVLAFVPAFFAAAVMLFKIDPDDRSLNVFARLFLDTPFSDSPAPFGLARALLIAAGAVSLAAVAARQETRLAARGSTMPPLVRRVALFAAIALTVVGFFDYSLNNDTLHYLTNVAPALHILHGAAPFVETFSQYGPGPLFLTVAAFLIGPPTFGTAQVAVQVFNLAYCAIWLVCLYRMAREKLAAMLLGICAIAVFLGTWAYGYANVHEAPSHLGVRYLPALLMVLAVSGLRPPRRHSVFTAACAFAAGMWSIEALIGTLGIHLAFLGLVGLRDRRFGRLASDILAAAAPVAAGVLAFTLFVRLRYGTAPDFGTYLAYLATYNPLSYPWAQPASPRFFGWMAMLLAAFLLLGDAWVRVLSPTARVMAIDDVGLFYRFVPMAMLLVLQAAYFVARSVDYTLDMALLPFSALAIPASFAFVRMAAASRGAARLLVAVPLAIAVWSLTFASVALFRQHYSLLVRPCPNRVLCSSAPYSLLLHECRDHGRCTPSAIGAALGDMIHARPGLERVGTPRSDYWFDSAGIVADALSMIAAWAPDEPAVTPLLNAQTTVPGEYLATELALMYSGKRHHWPRSFTFTDELVDETVRRIIAAPTPLRAGEIVLVRRDEQSLGPLEAGILRRIRSEATLCPLAHPSMRITAYRVAGPAGCPPE